MSLDLGYFGPGSLTWRIHSEPVSMVGGLRSLLLQALHPEAMATMARASNFRDDPWMRLHRTVEYVAVVSFGTTAEADRAAAHVRGVHQRLGVHDSEQLAWVHACLVDSFLTAAHSAGVRLDARDADRYVAEQARAARLAGVPDARVPRTAAELQQFLTAIRPQLRATAQARAAARVVLAPPLPVRGSLQLPARLGWTTVSALAVGLLPGWARRMYRLPPLPGAGLASSATLRTLRGVLRAMPQRYREGPSYRRAKARAAGAQPLAG